MKSTGDGGAMLPETQGTFLKTPSAPLRQGKRAQAGLKGSGELPKLAVERKGSYPI